MYHGLTYSHAETPSEALELHTDAKVPAALIAVLKPTITRHDDGYFCELALCGFWGSATEPSLEGAIAAALQDLISYRCSVGTQSWLNKHGSPLLREKFDASWEPRESR